MWASDKESQENLVASTTASFCVYSTLSFPKNLWEQECSFFWEDFSKTSVQCSGHQGQLDEPGR